LFNKGRCTVKIIAAVVLILLLPVVLQAQPGVPRDVETVLARIEHAFQTSNPASIEDLLPMSTLMRLGDSLYWSASRIKALNLLKGYFADKESVKFRFNSPGTGMLTYMVGGKRESVNVDVWLLRTRGEVGLYALNISNYPSATVFMNIHPAKKKAGS
jgi:hypothetical protein